MKFSVVVLMSVLSLNVFSQTNGPGNSFAEEAFLNEGVHFPSSCSETFKTRPKEDPWRGSKKLYKQLATVQDCANGDESACSDDDVQSIYKQYLAQRKNLISWKTERMQRVGSNEVYKVQTFSVQEAAILVTFLSKFGELCSKEHFILNSSKMGVNSIGEMLLSLGNSNQEGASEIIKYKRASWEAVHKRAQDADRAARLEREAERSREERNQNSEVVTNNSSGSTSSPQVSRSSSCPANAHVEAHTYDMYGKVFYSERYPSCAAATSSILTRCIVSPNGSESACRSNMVCRRWCE